MLQKECHALFRSSAVLAMSKAIRDRKANRSSAVTYGSEQSGRDTLLLAPQRQCITTKTTGQLDRLSRNREKSYTTMLTTKNGAQRITTAQAIN